MNGEMSIDKVQAEVAPVVAKANALQIVTPDDYAAAAEITKTVKGWLSKADTMFVEPWRKQKASAEAERKKMDELLCAPLRQAEGILKDKQLAWSEAAEAKRQAEEKRLQAEADAQARADREKAERAAAKLKTPELREARLEQAAAIVAPLVTVASAAPVVKGQSIRKTWKAAIIEKRRAIEWALTQADWEGYIDVNESAFDAFAKRTKGSVQIPGVTFREVSGLASSSK